LFAALLVAMVYRFARAFVSRPASAAAAVLTLAQPHYFFHAPIACFDAPITTMAFAVGFAYWKSLRDPRWGIAAGLLFGVALGVKHNAWLMPFFLVGHYVWMRRGDLRARRLPRVPLAFLSMLVLGPIVFFLHWPWLWSAPVGRTRAYINRHLLHEHYNFEYLGLNWNNPPTTTGLKLLRATAPWVQTGLTVPVTTLALAAVGAGVLARRKKDRPVSPDGQPEAPIVERPSWLRPGADVDRAPGAFIVVQTVGPLAVLTIPSTPIFGGVKHFMTAMPYLAVLAGIGLAALAPILVAALPAARERLRRAAPVALAAIACLPAVVETRRSHPDGLSHYNLIAGGFAGGASLGMNRQFWGYAVAPMLDVIEHDPENRGMYWHDVISDALAMYKREGRLSMPVGNTGFAEEGIRRSRLGILFHEKHWAIYEGWFWESYGTTRPAMVREREGVPLVTLYRRPPQ
jgi:4-amino-4-deoxy-L-arabinose transferase-like glycosyltransferase